MGRSVYGATEAPGASSQIIGPPGDLFPGESAQRNDDINSLGLLALTNGFSFTNHGNNAVPRAPST